MQVRLPHPLAAVLFDFDETIIDLEPQHSAAHRALSARFGSDFDALPEDFRHGSGRRIIDDVVEMADFFGWKESRETLYAMRNTYFLEQCRSSDLSLLPGAESAIRAVADRRIPLAITTSADGTAVAELLDRFDLRGFFAVIVAGDDVDRGKPDPEPYLVTARRLGVDPSRCLVFEDSSRGVTAARRAGAFCIAIRNPNAMQHQDVGAADLVLSSFEEFDPAWLDGRPWE